jgi:hypothetical protein
MKIVELTVFLEVPDAVAEAWDGDDTEDKASNCAIDCLHAHFPDDFKQGVVELGMILVRKVTDE